MANPTRKQQLKVAMIFATVAVFMLGAAYAAVPLYRLFCQVTGIDGTPKRAEAAPASISTKTIKVRFDANIANGLPWKFAPKDQTVTVHLGEPRQIEYISQSLVARETKGTATFNVLPEAAAKYFSKIQCFCFNEQTLKPGEKVDMPVLFFVDPELLNDEEMKNIDTITLSYTFFPVKDVLKQSKL